MLLVIVIGVIVVWLLRGKGSQMFAGSRAAGNSFPAPSDPFDAYASPLSVFDGGPSGLDKFSQAIFQHEGAQPGDVSYDNNNPGNLRYAPGETGTNRGFATFGNFGDGLQALKNYIAGTASANPGWDFYDFFQHYLGQKLGGPTVTDQGDSDSYAESVASQLGVAPTMPVASYLQGGN